MPTTRRQAAAKERGEETILPQKRKVTHTRPDKSSPRKQSPSDADLEAASDQKSKKRRKTSTSHDRIEGEVEPQTGTIERGHIYFFYRVKVQHKRAESLDDVKNFHMLLVPRVPAFAASLGSNANKGESTNPTKTEVEDMKVLDPGADARPAPAPVNEKHQKYRLITIGKKKLPEPGKGGKGKGRKETFWGTVSAVGNDLDSLENGLGEKTYETKTRGTRHEEPARLVARGAYAIVNNNPDVPSKRETHLGYHLSHPSEIGDSSVQDALGIQKASSFVMQVKNPLAPASMPGQGSGTGAQYPQSILENVFGKGGKKGRESYGLRFAACETVELLDYEGAQLLFIAARAGEDGLELSLGDDRGKALEENENSKSTDRVFQELGLDRETFPDEVIVKGEWI